MNVRRLLSAGIIGSIAICAPEFFPADAATPPAENTPAASALPSVDRVSSQFDAQIAPLLARHCLECHDSGTKKGRLNLSRKDTAMAGGKSGKAILPGNAAESPLWQVVQSDEMPDERPPLSPEEKQVLRDWIDTGAVWTADEIDPLAYTRDSRAAYNFVRRLTVPEYIETVRSALGVDIEAEARAMLPPDVRADGFNNTAYNLNIDLKHVEAYARLAQVIVRRMDVMAFASPFNDDAELSESSMRHLVEKMGTWILRGPLQKNEIDAFLRVSDAVLAADGNLQEAIGFVLEAMLQSPRFMYRIEDQRGDGNPRPVGQYELASRLSYTIWGAPPDKELMRAARAGELSDSNHLQAQVYRMLDDPRAVDRSAQFLHEWLDLDRLDNLRPDPKRFRSWNQQLAADMREETLAFFKEIAWKQKRPLADLMNAQLTFATPRLAHFYGLQRDPAAIKQHEGKDGLVALYTFEEGAGDVIHDKSGSSEPIDLNIQDASSVQWAEGQLRVSGATLITNGAPVKRLTDAIKKSKALTLEVLITPADTRQTGPARILTFSSGSSQRNFTLGQDGGRYQVRFRARGTDNNGLPALSSRSGAVSKRLTHIVFTRDPAGNAKLYIDGEENGSRIAAGDLGNWSDEFTLGIANESSKDRPWLGTFHLAAIYDRALTPEEVRSRSGAATRYDLSSNPARGGLLTQASVLTIGGDEASMVARGLFILHDFLYSAVGNPPPCADTTPVPTKAGVSQRAVAEARIANPSCGGCHSKFEPLAFGLEKFDGLGAYHEVDEHGNKLRDDGEITLPGEEHPVQYGSSAELMNLLAGSERLRKNITRKVTQFALGRPLVESDARALDTIHQVAQNGGGTYAALISAVVMSDLVRMTGTERTNTQERIHTNEESTD